MQAKTSFGTNHADCPSPLHADASLALCPSPLCNVLNMQMVMIPIVLERYSTLALGDVVKDSSKVTISTSIDFTNFVNSDSNMPEGFRIFLQSLIVHVGARPDEGHYIAMGRDESLFKGEGGWLLHDDLQTPLRPLRAFRTLQVGLRLAKKACIVS